MSDVVPPLSDAAKSFRTGIYRHYKGGLYHALMVGRNSEARDQEFVVYRSLERGFVWIRPLGMFLENVEWEGKNVQRFAWVEGAA